MDEIKQLELLSESIQNEIDELQSLLENSDDIIYKAKRLSFQRQFSNIINNLKSANDSVYIAFEEINSNDIDSLQEDYDILYEILRDRLSHDEKVDMRIKYGIDFY
jgi:ABC-type transporter Mla subunit MlaD